MNSPTIYFHCTNHLGVCYLYLWNGGANSAAVGLGVCTGGGAGEIRISRSARMGAEASYDAYACTLYVQCASVFTRVCARAQP